MAREPMMMSIAGAAGFLNTTRAKVKELILRGIFRELHSGFVAYESIEILAHRVQLRFEFRGKVDEFNGIDDRTEIDTFFPIRFEPSEKETEYEAKARKAWKRHLLRGEHWTTREFAQVALGTYIEGNERTQPNRNRLRSEKRKALLQAGTGRDLPK